MAAPLADYTHYEVAFPAQDDLGIGIKVDKDGRVVVSDVTQLKGYAELQCPALTSGDILVAVDHEAVADKSFQQVTALLRESKQTRPTHLEFLSVDYYDSRADAVAKWSERYKLQHQHQHEGEFDVNFEPQQPTGLRFTESYVIAHPLKLTHIDDLLYSALHLQEHAAVCKLLENTVLVRIGSQSVLGAPVSEVTALLRQTTSEDTDMTPSFPKALWLASAENLDDDYVVLTIFSLEQLKWLSFVPIEMMMEVPAVSFAAKAMSQTAKQQSAATIVKANDNTFQRERRDGVKSEQYLMAINGISTLRLSAPASTGTSAPITNSLFHGGTESSKLLLDGVAKALDGLLNYQRTLRFRDLTQYRREFQQHQPLSPWSRRRRLESLVMVESKASGLSSLRDTMSRDGKGDRKTELKEKESDSVASDDVERSDSVTITRRPRDLYELLMQERDATSVETELQPPLQCSADRGRAMEPSDPVSDVMKRPHIKRYRGMENCEGTRRMASSENSPTCDKNVRTVVIPDNLRPVGIQLETELMTTFTIFKSFTRMDGPALTSRQVVRGDVLVSIDGMCVKDILMDTLIRLLQGQQQEQYQALSESKLCTKVRSDQQIEGVRVFTFARKKPRDAVVSLLAGLWGKSFTSSRANAHQHAVGNGGQGEKKNIMVEFIDLGDELRAASTVD